MSTNARVVRDVLASKRNTFFALKELINNSIKAGATRICIDIIPSNCDLDSPFYHPIDKIIVSDNGEGVSQSLFGNRIMEIATESVEGCNGVGRFSGLQIGRRMDIETTAFDKQLSQKTKTSVTFKAADFFSSDLANHEFEVQVLDASTDENGYCVVLSELYNNEEQCKLKNKLTADFKEDRIKQSLFESYYFYIFKEKIKFYVNGEELKRDDFCIKEPHTKIADYKDKVGKNHKVIFQFYSLKLSDSGVRIFLQSSASIKTTIAEFSYNSIWYSPDAMGAQFIVVESDVISPELSADFTIDGLGQEEWNSYSLLIREVIDEYYKEGDVKYKTFLEKLEADKYYPYKNEEKGTHWCSQKLFERSAYVFEDKMNLLEKNVANRKIIYLLLRSVIENGDLAYLFGEVLGLSKESRRQLTDLLKKTDLSEIVRFSSEVARKEQFIDFLNKLIYGKISKLVKERSQLHKIIEKELWVFGEEYNNTLKLWSDESLANNLDELHSKYLNYALKKEDENLINEVKGKVRSITDLFFYNEKKLGDGRREVMIVELKAPKCAISHKELTQVDRYAYEISSQSQYPKQSVTYKILLISSKITDYARTMIDANKLNIITPFLYKKINENGADIRIYVMEWSELIEKNKMHLSYLSNGLKVKYEEVSMIFEKDYPDLLIPNKKPILKETR